MQSRDALDLVAYIRQGKTPKDRVSFVESIEKWARSGKKLTPKQSYVLQDIYRRSQGHGERLYSRVETIKKGKYEAL
jgi:hypothetical protein